MSPQDAQPWADEIGAPNDGKGQAPPRHHRGDHRSGWCLTRDCTNCTYPPCPHHCHQEAK